MDEGKNAVLNEYQPSVFWSFNDVLEKDELRRQLDELLKAGFSGGFLHSRVGLVTEYMSEDWLDAVRCCCEAAKERNTALWLYDEDRFPSGYAGGAVLAQKDSLRTKALCLIPAGEEDKYTILKTYKTVSADEKDYSISLCAARDGNPNYEGKCYVDLLDPETTEVFIRQTHEKYRQTVGEYFGKQIKGIFSDEFTYTQKAAFPCFSVPFTNNLEQEFNAVYGYDLVDCLEKLFFDLDGYSHVRRDFYEMLTNRFIRSFTKPYNDWCNANGLTFTGHLIHEDFLTTQPEWTGAVMPHYAHMEMPGIDKLGSDPNYLLTVKQLTSVTEQLGKRSLCEAFGCTGHQFGPAEIKRVADWLCVLGINFINPHLTLYSARGERKRDYPPDFSWRQPWYEVSRACFDHISRVCHLMDSGKVETDVLIVHPIQSVWAEYSPMHKMNPTFSIWAPKNENAGQNFITETEYYQKPFLDLSNQLLEAGINYHYGDEMILADYGRFEDGVVVGQCSYRKIIVPPVSVLRNHTIALLVQMAERFGKDSVVFIGKIPDCIPNEKRHLFSIVDSPKVAVLMLIKERKMPVEVRDIHSGQISDKVFYRCCRDENGQKTVFITNTSRDRSYDVRLRLPYDHAPVVMDTVTGDYYQVPGNVTDNGYVCNLHLKVGGSAMFVEVASASLKMASVLQSGAVFASDLKGIKTILSPVMELTECNVLPLDVVNYVAGDCELKNRPVESIWHSSFYRLENGTPFEAEYAFYVAKVPENPVVALIEMARNLDEVQVNGMTIRKIQKGNTVRYFDGCFDTVVLDNLQEGRNTIRIRGRKCSNINGIGSHTRVPTGTYHPSTEVECVYLCGEFGVANRGGGKYEIVEPTEHLVGSTAKSLQPFYLGSMKCSFDLDAATCRIRVDGRAHAAQLRINGDVKATAYITPFEFDIPEGSQGRAEIRIYNSLENTFGPLHLSGRANMAMMGPVYFPDMKRYTAEPELFDYGIWSISMLKEK